MSVDAYIRGALLVGAVSCEVILLRGWLTIRLSSESKIVDRCFSKRRQLNWVILDAFLGISADAGMRAGKRDAEEIVAARRELEAVYMCQALADALRVRGVVASVGARWDTGPAIRLADPRYHSTEFWYFYPQGGSVGFCAEYPAENVRAFDAGTLVRSDFEAILARITALDMHPTREAIWCAIEPEIDK